MAEYILIGGGCIKPCERECLASCELLSGSNPIAFEPFVDPRRGAKLAKFGSNLVVVGGCSDFGHHLDSIEVNCLDNSSPWQRCVTKLPFETSCFSFCQFNQNSAILFGGYDGRDCLNKVCSITQKDHVMVVTDLPRLRTRLKNGAALQVDSDTILLIGGWDEVRTLNTIFSFSIKNHTCEFKMSLPSALEGHTVTTIVENNFALIVGGYNGYGVQNGIYLLNFKNNKCNKLEIKLDIARENHCAEFKNQELIIFNGWSGSNTLDSIEVFAVINCEPWLIRKESRKSLIARNKPCSIQLDF
uniref:Uncharacterized protein n=1 Tax=Rhabditophanes sp. KR3021 TaxID=114890 RepID=A0AC35UIC0_9BILA